VLALDRAGVHAAGLVQVAATVPSRLDPEWILVDGTQQASPASMWAAWLVRRRARWVVYYLGFARLPFAPAKRGPVPCDIRPALGPPSCGAPPTNARAYAVALYTAWRGRDRLVT
jgi:hypothetical protein